MEDDDNPKIENIKHCDAVLLFIERQMRRQEDMDSMLEYLTAMTILASVRRDLAEGTVLEGVVSIDEFKNKKDQLTPAEAADRILKDLGYE
jgi:hypothetical protein